MNMRIRQLSAAVANQIAAGEVIERPASIVKELLENAQDAKATAVTIDIGHGGLNQVKISDNGTGILAEDLPLAIAAHATSKLSSLTDLYAITSMGFRGEALASIASITRVSISSKPAEQETGMILQMQGEQQTLLPSARTQGTTIDARDIFYNAPVRKKFLKSERSEFQAIDAVVRRFALGSPAIAITLNHNGKLQLQLPAATDEASRMTRMIKLLGKAFVEQSLLIDARHAGMHLQGRISDLSWQRSQHDKMWVYLNGRMVKDKLIQHAIKQAYEGLLHPGRFPSCLLYLTMEPGEVDVNVHPTKHEVRFQQPRYVHDFIRSQLQATLSVPQPAPDYLFEREPRVVQ
ncbi:MAG: DNA mismatch repair endonuclease MutL, partial [Prosthecobacter sp.]|nr:DNA mismatch repair endonuclease MutL [Prosthecobacter sp.]